MKYPVILPVGLLTQALTTQAGGEQQLVLGMSVWQSSVDSAVESKVKPCAAAVSEDRHGCRRGLACAGHLGACTAFLVTLLLVICWATPLHGASITLGWYQDANAAIAGFNVYYGTASQDYMSSVQTGPQPFCDIHDLDEGTTYYFAVSAFDSNGVESGLSPEISYTVPILAPTVQVQACILPDGNVLVWNESPDPNVAGYNVYYGTASGQYIGSVQTGPDFVATISGLEQGTTYYFAVTSYDSSGVESGFSQEQTYTTLFFPTAQVVAALQPEGQALYWYVRPGTNVVSYIIHYGASPGEYTNSIDTSPDFVGTITGLVETTTYYFAVAPLTDTGQEGLLSNEQSYTVPVLDLAVQGTVLPDGTNAFDITGPANNTYAVVGSPDGLEWTVLGIGTIGPDGTLEILEPPGTLDIYPLYKLVEVNPPNARPNLRLSRAPDGTVTLSAAGQAGQPYAVLATSTLAPAAWTYLATVYGDSSGNLSFTDTGSANLPARFYKLQNVSYAPPMPTLQIAQDPSTGTLLTGSGQPNQAYSIFATPDLANWSLLGTVTSDATGTFEFTDFGSFAFPSRFYRAAQVPN